MERPDDVPPSRTTAGLLRELGTPLLIHQPSYSMLNRWIEDDGLLDAAQEEGFGIIGFSTLQQGLLTDRYLNGIPEGSRATQGKSLDAGTITETVTGQLRRLDKVAGRRGQSLSQLALAWALRDERVTSLVIGASSVAQLEQNVGGLDRFDLDAGQLAQIEDVLSEPATQVELWTGIERA